MNSARMNQTIRDVLEVALLAKNGEALRLLNQMEEVRAKLTALDWEYHTLHSTIRDIEALLAADAPSE